MSNVTCMGTRTLWLCLSMGIACSPRPTLQSTQSTNSARDERDSAVDWVDAGTAGAEDGGARQSVRGDSSGSDALDGAVKQLPDAAMPNEAISDAAIPALDAGRAQAADTEPDAAKQNYETPPETDAMPASETWVDAGSTAGSDAFTCDIPQIQGSECNLEVQCGCDPDAVCRVADRHTGQTLCFPPGDTPRYAACDLDQDCGASDVCEAGICRPTCATPGAFCEDGSSCASFSEAGRFVCAGHCNVLARSPDTWSRAETWVDLMTKQFARGMRTDYWTAEYTDCGEGAYCHPGVGPDEAANASPLFPHCVKATGAALDNSPCVTHSDCVSGLACGVYPGETEGRCVRTGYVEGDCQNTGHRVQRNTSVDGLTLMSPDGINTLGLCTRSL